MDLEIELHIKNLVNLRQMSLDDKNRLFSHAVNWQMKNKKKEAIKKMACLMSFIKNSQKFVRENDPRTFFVSWDNVEKGNPPIGVARQSNYVPNKEGEYEVEDELVGQGRRRWAIVVGLKKVESVDISGWQPKTCEDSQICHLSLTGGTGIGEKADKSYYKHYGLKNATALELYSLLEETLKEAPVEHYGRYRWIQRGDKFAMIRYHTQEEGSAPPGCYHFEFEGDGCSERIRNFEAVLKRFGIEYEVLSDVKVCHEFMAMMLKAQFDPFSRE